MNWIEDFKKLLFPLDKENLDVEAAYSYKDKHLPKSICKYREVNHYSINNLEEDTIWLSSPQSFNDPYDCAYSINSSKMIEYYFSTKFEEIIKISGLDKYLNDISIKKIKASKKTFETMLDQALLQYPDKERDSFKKALSYATDKVFNNMFEDNIDVLKNSIKLCSFSERG